MPEMPSIPPAPDLAALSPITILPPFSCIQNPAGGNVYHFPVSLHCRSRPVAMAGPGNERGGGGGGHSSFIDMQQTAVAEQRPLSTY